MLFERLSSTEDCSFCELQDICNAGYISIPSYSVVTCEAFKNAVRKYGGKEKLQKDLFEKIKEFIEIEKLINGNQLLQGYSFETILEETNMKGSEE